MLEVGGRLWVANRFSPAPGKERDRAVDPPEGNPGTGTGCGGNQRPQGAPEQPVSGRRAGLRGGGAAQTRSDREGKKPGFDQGRSRPQAVAYAGPPSAGASTAVAVPRTPPRHRVASSYARGCGTYGG